METSPKLKTKELKAFLLHFKSQSDFNEMAFSNLYQDTSEETVVRMLAHFEQNLKNTIGQVEIGLNKESPELIWRAAHKMAGTSELLGFGLYAKESRDLSKLIQTQHAARLDAEKITVYLEKTKKLLLQINTIAPSLKLFL